MTAEIAQVRKEADHYVKATQLSKSKNQDKTSKAPFIFKQNLTEDEIAKKKELKRLKNEKFRKKFVEKKKKMKQQKLENKNKDKVPLDDNFLGSVFVGNEEN